MTLNRQARSAKSIGTPRRGYAGLNPQARSGIARFSSGPGGRSDRRALAGDAVVIRHPVAPSLHALRVLVDFKVHPATGTEADLVLLERVAVACPLRRDMVPRVLVAIAFRIVLR